MSYGTLTEEREPMMADDNYISIEDRKRMAEAARARAVKIKAHNKLQTRYALTKNPITKNALAERLKQSWIALGGPMPKKEVGDA